MISNIYSKLSKYGDKLANEGRNNERRVVHQCESLVHDAYMEGVNNRRSIENGLPNLEGLEAFLDTNDGEAYFELDNRHFDSITEVVDYLIEFHNHAVQYKKGHPTTEDLEQRRHTNGLTNGNREFVNKLERSPT